MAVAASTLAACSGGPYTPKDNVNAPRGNAIGDRHPDFMRVVAHARTLPTGRHDSSILPPELQLKNLLTVYVDKRKAYALEFPSISLDSNPIYVFVEDSVQDPEGVVKAMCGDHVSWYFSRQLDEPGWYYVHGP
jgi:hypothetical protein